jgi:hypothetical protein
MTLRASSSFPKSSRYCYPFLSDGFHDTSNAFPFLTADDADDDRAKAQSDFERRDEGANDESRRSAKKREHTTFAYDEQFMRSLNTEENSARRLPALDDAQILLLLQRKREDEEDEDEDEEVAVVEEEKPPPGTSTFSSLWATEAQFAKDAATLERLMLEQVKEAAAAAAAKRTAEKKRSEDDQRGASPRVSTVKVVRGDDLFSRHAMRSFKRIESRDGNIERAFGGRRFRKLYGRIVAKSEKKKGTTVDVYIDRVQGYTDDDDDDDDDNDDNAVVGCVDASSAGLDVNFEDTPAFRNEVRRRIDANDAIEGVRRPFVFVQLDSLVSSFGSECRFECYDARNDFEPLDFEIL